MFHYCLQFSCCYEKVLFFNFGLLLKSWNSFMTKKDDNSKDALKHALSLRTWKLKLLECLARFFPAYPVH